MGKKNVKRYDPEFTARVALEAAQEEESLAQIGQRYRVHPVARRASGRSSCLSAPRRRSRVRLEQRGRPHARRAAQERSASSRSSAIFWHVGCGAPADGRSEARAASSFRAVDATTVRAARA